MTQYPGSKHFGWGELLEGNMLEDEFGDSHPPEILLSGYDMPL